MRKLLEWAGYVGLAVLAAAVILPFARPDWLRVRPWLVGVGAVLVVLSLLVYLREARATLRGRTARYGLNTALMIVLLLGIIAIVEAVSYRHNARLDLTENRRNSLAPQTIQLLRDLKNDVSAVAFFRSDQPGKRVAEDLFKQYARYAGGRFSWKVVDPDREPGLARRYNVETYGTVVLETKDKSEKVTDAEEEKVTNGLVRLTREGKRVVYVIQGHGEHELNSSDRAGFSEAKKALEGANYEVKPLALTREGKISDDAAVVIDPGPRTDPLSPEIDALNAYLGRGGKLLVMVNPFQNEGMKKFLAAYGVDLGDDLVIESNPIGRMFGIGPEVPIVQQYEPHPITRDMAGITTLFPLTRSVSSAKAPPRGVNVQPLVKTSPQSWGETDRAALNRGEVRADDKDIKGPSVAVVVTKDKARIVVYGTSNLASNQFLNLQGNRDLFLNTVSWLAEQEDQISIRPKETKSAPVFLTSQQGLLVFLLPVVVLPAVVLAGGVVAAVRRRAAK
jgi:gliding motility-associatede transport system auxiliary component